MIKEVRINSDRVKATCINQDWYTKGTCEEYEHLLIDLCKDKASDDDIMAVVYDIYNHTNIERIYKVYGVDDKEILENIAYYIYNDCISTFITLE